MLISYRNFPRHNSVIAQITWCHRGKMLNTLHHPFHEIEKYNSFQTSNIIYYIMKQLRENLIPKENVHNKLSEMRIQNIMFKMITILFLNI